MSVCVKSASFIDEVSADIKTSLQKKTDAKILVGSDIESVKEYRFVDDAWQEIAL